MLIVKSIFLCLTSLKGNAYLNYTEMSFFIYQINKGLQVRLHDAGENTENQAISLITVNMK